MSSQRIATVLVVGMVLLSVVPVTAVAQAAPSPLLLNQDRTSVGTVSLDGERYQVYRFESSLAYASGISVYHDGAQIRSESRVRRVLSAMAQRRAVAALGQTELDTLRTVRAQARILANETGSAASFLNETVAANDDLRDVTVDGETAWNASVAAAPSFRDFHDRADDLQPALLTTEENARSVVATTTDLIRVLEARQNGTDVSTKRVWDRYDAAMDAIDRLSGQSYKIDGLTQLADLSRQVATDVETVPETGPDTADRFRRVGNETETAANRTTAAFETLDRAVGLDSTLSAVKDTARATQERWMASWRDRRYAPRDVYGTIVGVPVAIIAALGYVQYRR